MYWKNAFSRQIDCGSGGGSGGGVGGGVVKVAVVIAIFTVFEVVVVTVAKQEPSAWSRIFT